MPTERAFGRTVGTAFLLLAGVVWWRSTAMAAAVVAVVGTVLVLAALAWPAALRVPNRVWWRLAQALGWVNARVILTFVFAVLVTPLGLLMRLVGRDPLRPVDTATNWSAYTERRKDPTHFERMF